MDLCVYFFQNCENHRKIFYVDNGAAESGVLGLKSKKTDIWNMHFLISL